jgi:molecular chaperone DnaK (HSP70)
MKTWIDQTQSVSQYSRHSNTDIDKILIDYLLEKFKSKEGIDLR